MQQNKNNSFFKELFISIKDFDKYQEFAIEKTSKTIIYILKIIAIFTFIISLAFTYKLHMEKNKLSQYVNEDISDIKFENQKLTANNDEPLIVENDELINTTLVIDTSNVSEESIEKYKEIVNEKDNGFIILNDKIIMKTQVDSEFNNLLYTDLEKIYNITKFNKQDILNAINGKEIVIFYLMFFTMMYIYMFIIYFITIIIYALMLSLLGRLTSTLLKIPLKYRAIFNIATHALTLPILLNLIYIIINLFTGFTIKYFQIMYSTISYIYIITAILMIKADFIKKQIELSKILEEQQKIRQEYKNSTNKNEEKSDIEGKNIDRNSEEKTDINSNDKQEKQEPETDNG